MKTFTDSGGRVWTISLTIGSVKRVKDLIKIDLLALDQGKPPLLTRLGLDVVLLCDVVFALIKPQADEQEVTDVQFGEALGGDVILAAQDAFYEELISFFRGLGRKDLAKAVAAQHRIVTLAVEKIGEKIDDFDVEKMVEATFGKVFMNSPESLGSTPGGSPSEN